MTGFGVAAAKIAACPTCNILPSTMHSSRLHVKFLIFFTVRRKGSYMTNGLGPARNFR